MGKKKCKDGKNCGATCINRGKKCLLDLGEPLSADLSSASTYIKNSSLQDSPIPETPITAGVLSVAGAKFMTPYRRRLKLLKDAEGRSQNIRSILVEKYSKASTEKEKEELKAKMLRTLDLDSRTKMKQVEIMGEIREKLLRSNLSERETEGIVNRISIRSPDLNSDLTSNTRSHVKEFVQMFNGRGIMETFDGPATPFVKSIDAKEGARAHANSNNNSILTDGSKRATFHELGHFVEYQDRALAKYAMEWRDRKALTDSQVISLPKSDPLYSLFHKKGRPINWEEMVDTTSGEKPLFKLKDMSPYLNYKESELSYAGRYIAPYMGKVYKGKVTEVISVALEHFSETVGMYRLYKEHPDLFNTVVGLAVTPF